jgi:hypothetical protein
MIAVSREYIRRSIMATEVNALGQELLRKTRAGTSFWTTFRWIADFVYGVCWIIALPLELLLNRRMGRRYNAMLPMAVAILGVVGLYSYFGWSIKAMQELQTRGGVPLAFAITPRLVPDNSLLAPTQPGQFPRPRLPATANAAVPVPQALSSSPYFLPVVMGVLLLALIAHRVDNWWRFRTTEQVHSRHCGTPHWVWWLWQAMARLKPTGQEAAAVMEAKPSAVLPEGTSKTPTVGNVSRQSLRSFLRGAMVGVPPTGALAWLASTILHPLGLVGIGIAMTPFDIVVALHLYLVAVAIFLKARIQKALVVEAIYDVFDARIERVFMRGLESPKDMPTAARAGMVVPGIAEVIPQAMDRLPKQSPLSPEYESLVTAKWDAATSTSSDVR